MILLQMSQLIKKWNSFRTFRFVVLRITWCSIHVKTLLDKYPQNCFEKIEISEEAIELANRYIEEKVVGQTSLEDCRNIAMVHPGFEIGKNTLDQFIKENYFKINLGFRLNDNEWFLKRRYN